ncbi:hypothetical protein MHU86_1891 [Fragilaria crotonensis]|nr:hypothetical protein MHU86_1891 [Fragilaria crotonensis]
MARKALIDYKESIAPYSMRENKFVERVTQAHPAEIYVPTEAAHHNLDLIKGLSPTTAWVNAPASLKQPPHQSSPTTNYRPPNSTTNDKHQLANARIVRTTIRSEQCRTMFQNLRKVVKPTERSSLDKLLLPRHKDTPTYPSDFQSFLLTTDPEDIIWDTVLDKETIEHNLLRYNRNSFRAAAASPCGHGPIFNGLSFNSLSVESEALLAG